MVFVATVGDNEAAHQGREGGFSPAGLVALWQNLIRQVGGIPGGGVGHTRFGHSCLMGLGGETPLLEM
jgi:hypothetical protein